MPTPTPRARPLVAQTLPGWQEVAPGVVQGGLVTRFPRRVAAVLALCERAEMAWAARHGYPDPFAAGLKAYCWKPVPDHCTRVPPLAWLDAAVDVVAGWRRLGWVVGVHCAMGISRSTLVTAAYRVRELGEDHHAALAAVRLARRTAGPNAGFVRLLAEYAARHRPPARPAPEDAA